MLGLNTLKIVSLISWSLMDIIMQDNDKKWWKDWLILLGIFHGSIIWLFMAINLNIKVAWISFACGGLIGLFLLLIAIGYENPRFAKATIIGILINLLLSMFSFITSA